MRSALPKLANGTHPESSLRQSDFLSMSTIVMLNLNEAFKKKKLHCRVWWTTLEDHCFDLLFLFYDGAI